jgi:uncharacterized membrane protein
VAGKIVTGTTTYTYKNGTIQSNLDSVNVQDGTGTLGIFIIAGGLSAGYPIYQTPIYSFPYIGETATKLYAGALRSTNVVNVSNPSGPYAQQFQLEWDAQTGFLINVYENITYPGQSYEIQIKVTSTNVWSPSTTADFGFDAIPQSSQPVNAGASPTYNLVFNSTKSFAGKINLTPTLLNSTLSQPVLSLSRTSVMLSAGKTNSSILKFSTTASTPLGLYIFSVNGTSGSLSHTVTLAVTVSPPDFSITAKPANLTLGAGSSKSSIITITALGSFSGNVSLSYNISPPLTATLQPPTVTLSPTVTSATSNVTVVAPSGSPPSPYDNLYVAGTSGLLSHSVYIPLNVTGPDFRMSATPSTLTLKQGGTAKSTITLTSILGFHGNVFLFVNSYGVNSSLDKSQVFLNTTATATLTISVQSNAQPGYYYAYVNGNSGNITRYAYVVANVTGPDLRISISPSLFTLKQGTSANATITLTSILNFEGKVALTAFDFNFNGPQVVLNPANVTLAANATATSKLTISTPGTAPGYYTIQVQATGGNLTRYAYVEVQVIGPDFTMSSSTFSLTVRQGGSATSTINLSRLNNFNGTIALSTIVQGPFPGGGLSASINPTSVTLSATTTRANATLTVTASQSASPGHYTVQAIGTSGAITHTAYVFVNVVGPDLQMNINPSNLIIKEGMNATSTITLTSLQNFHGTVALSANSFNFNGPRVSLNPSSLTLVANGTATSTLTISTAGVPPGYYTIQVQATGGNLTRFGYVNVQVIGPDFNISSTSYFFILRQGNSATSTISLSRVENFNGTIGLSAFAYGPFSGGLVASISPRNVTLTSTATSATANLTMSASQTATTGFYTVQVTATSGTITHTIYITVDVTLAPDFEISATSPADFNSGGIGKSTITIIPLNGFSGTVTLTTSTSPATGLIPGCPTSITVVNGTAPVTATCSLVSTTPGTYHVGITATGGGLTRTANFTSNVGSFKVSAVTPTDLNSGATGKIPIVVSSLHNFSGKVTLTGFSSSAALTVTCPTVPVNVTANANAPSACTLSSTTAGTYTVTIVGNGLPGTFAQSTSAVVHVGDFAISASSGSFNAGASGASIRISITSTYNFAGSVSLAATSSSSTGLNVVCPIGPIPLTANSTSIASCTLGSAISGTYQITVTGTGTLGNASHNTISTLHVGDFAISVAPTNINLGSDGSISVSLTSVNNFAGTISLSDTTVQSVFSQPLTITCPFAPNLSANSTITVSCSVTSTNPGTYSITITGTGSIGASSHSASATVHIGDFTIHVGSQVNFNLGTPNSKISLNVTSTLNFAGTIVLTSDVSPATGLTVTCPAVIVAANATSSTYCTLNGDKTGSFLVTITGTSLPGTGSHSSSGTVQISDFTITTGEVSPSPIKAGDSGSASITVATVNGFSETVTLAVSPPSGIACSFDHTTIQSPGSSNLSCTGNTPGDYTVTVTAIGKSTFHQTHLTFHVASAPAQVPTSPTMFGLQVPQFYALLGGVIVAITVAGVTATLRRKK